MKFCSFGKNDSEFEYDNAIAVSASNVVDTLKYILSTEGKIYY